MNRPGQTGAGPVDVLGVMAEAADLLAGCPDPEVAEESERDMRKARAAVAELVEAARASEAAWARIHDGYPPSTASNAVAPMRANLRAALAKFGGAA